MKNIVFIDGQNLYLGTRYDGWNLDFKKFFVYLKDKFKTSDIYYFIGYSQGENKMVYKNLSDLGYTIVFKKHSESIFSKKKGNVDIDIVFEVMKNIIENQAFDKAVIVSGDGDYKKLISYLISKNKFLKIVFPNYKYASSLYKKLGNEFLIYLSNEDVKCKICLSDPSIDF